MLESTPGVEKHITKCENFQRRMGEIYENNLCRATGTENVHCGGFSDGCISPPHFTPRDGYPIEKVAFSLEESCAYKVDEPKPNYLGNLPLDL